MWYVVAAVDESRDAGRTDAEGAPSSHKSFETAAAAAETPAAVASAGSVTMLHDQDVALVYTGWAKKAARQTYDHNSCRILTDLIFLLEDFWVIFAGKWILKIPPHVACVATLPCEPLMPAN